MDALVQLCGKPKILALVKAANAAGKCQSGTENAEDAPPPKKQCIGNRELINLFEHAPPNVPGSWKGRGVFAPPTSTARLRATSQAGCAVLPDVGDVCSERSDALTVYADATLFDASSRELAERDIARSRATDPEDFEKTIGTAPHRRKIRSWTDIVTAEGGVTQRALERMILFLSKHPAAKHFLRPVVHAGYTDWITKPMDLGTVRQLISEASITTMEEVLNHVRLIHDNAVYYNEPHTVYVRHAKKLLEVAFSQAFGVSLEHHRARR